MKGASLIAPLGVRIPDDLKEKIQEKAKSNGRSMNAEIIFLLEQSLHLVDAEKHNEKLHELAESRGALIEKLQTIIQLQERNLDLAYEQISLLKHHIKSATGFDVQSYFDKTVDYEGINEAIKLKHKKPT